VLGEQQVRTKEVVFVLIRLDLVVVLLDVRGELRRGRQERLVLRADVTHFYSQLAIGELEMRREGLVPALL
jgi:hypothetical protein